jgi:hypothetical protein
MIRSLGDMSIERVVLPYVRTREKIKQQRIKREEKLPFNEPHLNIR